MKPKTPVVEQMRAEYRFDYANAVRGKYLERLVEEGAVVVVLEPDVAKVFSTSAAVNEALRGMIKSGRPARR